MARLDENGLKRFFDKCKELFLTKDSDNIKTIESKLEGVTKAADASSVIKQLYVGNGKFGPNSSGAVNVYVGEGIIADGSGSEMHIDVDTNYLATKQSVDAVQERAEGNSISINENLAKITALNGKLSGVENVKDFVNSSIATNTAEFKGTHNSLEELQIIAADANDYGFVVSKDAEGNTVYNRYKYVEGQGWVFEYALNNSSFTAAQWAAIQSGMTQADVEKLRNEVATKNEVDVVETLAESVNTGLGETIQRVGTLEQDLKHKADIEDLPNVVAEDVIDNETFPPIATLTRGELKKDLFIDLWNKACIFPDETIGKYNEETQMFELNGITDIGYEEAVRIYTATASMISGGTQSQNKINLPLNIRTHFPVVQTGNNQSNCQGMFNDDGSCYEVLYFKNKVQGIFLLSNTSEFLRRIPKVKKILGILSAQFTGSISDFYTAPELEEVKLHRISKDHLFSGAPKLSAESVRYMVQNAANTSTVTFTYHTDVYSKIIKGEGEWAGILDLAISKNISIASA